MIKWGGVFRLRFVGKVNFMKARIVSIILVIALCLSFFSVGVVQASAYSTGYPNTHKNTGNQVKDIISIAKTQVGYTENGGTKYGAWLGNANMAWCAAFVSWCASKAGIPSSIIPPSSNVSGLVNIGAYHFATNISGYVPSAGDLMLFKPLANSNNDSYYTPSIKNGKYTSYSHVALVVSADAADGTVTIIDGNWSRAVKYRTISLSTYYIAAYVTPKYQTGYDHSASLENNIYYSEHIDAPVVSKTLYPSKSNVEIKWDSLKGATSYRLRIYNADGERILTKNVSQNYTTVSGLGDGLYTATVTASFSGLSGQESSGTEFSIQNIANGITSRTVKDGVYVIKSLDNGYTLATASGNKSFILSRDVVSSAKKFTVTYVADGKYRVSAENDFSVSTGFAGYTADTLYYIVPQSDGSYIFELAENEGVVLSCGFDTIASNYCPTSTSVYIGADTQKWQLCDSDGNKVSAEYIEHISYITSVQPHITEGKLIINVTTSASANIDKLQITIATSEENTITYASQYTQVGDELVWSISTAIPSQKAKIIVDYRPTGSREYSENYYSTTLEAYDGIIHSTIKDVSYSIDEEKLVVKVTTPATNFINGIRLSFADALNASIASTNKYIISGDNYIWTVEMNAPTQDIDLLIDYRNAGNASYAKDYCPVHIYNYENTLAQGIINSVHQSIVDDEITFIIKTTKSLSALKGIMATQIGESIVQAETATFIETQDSYIWTLTMQAPEKASIYRFYPLLNDEYIMSEAYTLNVFIPDSESVITNVTHTLVDDKLIFRVTTPCTDKISRIKLALANDCASNIVTSSQPVKVGNNYVWEITITEPSVPTAYCFDVRFTETSKYSKNYYFYQHSKSRNILDVRFDTSYGSTECIITTKAGPFNALTVTVDGNTYTDYEYTVVDNTYVWVINTGKASDSVYRFDLYSTTTEAYLNDYYSLYI